MIDRSLYDYFISHHLPRREVLNRLPFSVSIDDFWPTLQTLRKARAVQVPLSGLDGKGLWFVMTDSLMASGDRVASMARWDIDSIEPGTDILTDGLLDEAFFTSYVEGAPVSRLESRRFLKSGADPSNVGELLMQNNLSAIRYLTEHRYEPFSPYMLQKATRLLTNCMDLEVEEYRIGDEHQVPGRSGTENRVPQAAQIPLMMDSLCRYLNDYEMHPLLKAGVAQAVILLVRPFDEGNERLARMLSYMILMRNGYSFFRQFALSGMIAQDGILYYKAMDTVQDVRGEGDLTCFLEYYLGMLSRSVSGFEAYIAQKHRSKMEEKQPEENKPPHQPIAIHPVVEERDTPLPSRKKTPEIASRQKTIQSIDGIEKCTTPETIIAYITTQQGKQLRVIDTKPHLHRLGITEEDILRAMQESQSEFSQRALSVIRMLREDPTRMFSCRDIELTLGIKIGTVRRTCYTLASLNLIQTTQVRGHGNGHESHRYFCKKALAA